MLIYIAGAGAMGCRFGYQLLKNGQDVILLDNWDAHIAAIQSRGLEITGDKTDTVHIPIMHPTEATQKADLIILFTKAMQLPTMLQEIKQIIGPRTKVLCLLNGLGHEDVIRQYVPLKDILMGVTIWTAGLEGPGKAILAGTGTINLQSIDPNGKGDAEQIVTILNGAGLNAIYDDDVLPNIWRKACVNGTMNPTCALLECNIDQFFATDEAPIMVKNIIHEFVMVGEAKGIALDEDEITKYVMDTSVKAAHHYPSMYQDLVQNHRPTEINYINGAVARMGKQLNIATPYCQMITDLVLAKQQILGIK